MRAPEDRETLRSGLSPPAKTNIFILKHLVYNTWAYLSHCIHWSNILSHFKPVYNGARKNFVTPGRKKAPVLGPGQLRTKNGGVSPKPPPRDGRAGLLSLHGVAPDRVYSDGLFPAIG